MNNYMDVKSIQSCQIIYKLYNLSIVENSQKILKKKLNKTVYKYLSIDLRWLG